ncbi:unnamed protein product [Rotaria sp. Silwood2]|nr:unnamed protein product [Rotaria sp. Silwood2]
MPSEIVHCHLCGRRERGARAKFTIIGTAERQQKIYEGYEKHYGQPLKYDLINKKVHSSCYYLLTGGLKSVSTMNRTGRPKIMKRPGRPISTKRKMAANYELSLINIKNNYSYESNSDSFTTDLNLDLEVTNDSFSLFDQENDIVLEKHFMKKIKNTNFLNTSKSSHNETPLMDHSNHDTSFTQLSEFRTSIVPVFLSSPDIERTSRTEDDQSNLQYDDVQIFETEPTDISRKDVNVEIPISISDEQLNNISYIMSSKDDDNDNFDRNNLTPGGMQPTDRNHASQSSEYQESYIQCDGPVLYSFNSRTSEPEIQRQCNLTKEDEDLDFGNRSVKKNKRFCRKKVRKIAETRRSLRTKSTLYKSSLNDKDSNINSLFSSAFDELCSWLIELLQNGWLVSMVDVSAEYKVIVEQRKEVPKPNMFRTSSIQDRLKFKFGDMLQFEKQSKYNGTYVGLSDPRVYLRCAITKPKLWRREDPSSGRTTEKFCENFMNVIEELRHCIKNLLGNELYRHTRSEQLLTITNRLGHTPSYNTIARLHMEAAERSTSAFLPFASPHQQLIPFSHNFVVKVADNFDINPDRLHGNNSIHIMNQIIVSTPENDEIPIVVTDCLNNILDEIASTYTSTIVSSQHSTTAVQINDHIYFCKMFVNHCLQLPLFAYGLIKFVNDTSRVCLNYFSPLIPASIPMFSGFFATYMNAEKRPIHIVSFMNPINDDPNSQATAKKCMEETKEFFIDSKYQKEGVVVVDEKIYRSCMKEKYYQPDLLKNVFIYPGDFHLMKNMMVVIWSILEGSGIEQVFENIYKAAALRSIFRAHHFNKSLRSCKLLYTALYILLLEAFFDHASTSSLSINCIENLKCIINKIPSEFATDDISQKWFSQFLEIIERSNLLIHLQTWTVESSRINSTFRLWFFILDRLLEPLIKLYTSIRTCNFAARNAALYQFVPLFFATNHRNYSRLAAQHLYDLQSSSSYLFSRMARSFAVTRSERPFSKIKHADTYIPNTNSEAGRGRINAERIKDYHKLVKIADQEIRRTVMIAKQRNLKPLSDFFAFEFSPVPLSLCNMHNVDLFNQQTKKTAIDFLNKTFPLSFSDTCPVSTHQSAFVIDGETLFYTKPNPNVKTIREYAIQLFDIIILHLFRIHDRIDVVFDTINKKKMKQFINTYDHDSDKSIYQLNCNDRLESPFIKFAETNRISLAKCIRQCWLESDVIQRLPVGRVFVVGGPDSTAVRLQHGHTPQPDYLLESNNSESPTRILLHCNAISIDQCQTSVIINTIDTDVILLAIALSFTIFLQHLVVKSTNLRTKKDSFINIKSIAGGLRQASIDPMSLLVLHGISGCNRTSFIKNLTKEKIFNCFFNDPDKYSSISKLNCVPPPHEAISACEQLLLHCYPLGKIVHSLDELRAMMAEIYMKDRIRANISSSLPPSTAAFIQHCLRTARQVKIWVDCLDPNPTAPSALNSGYEIDNITGKLKVKWTNLAERSLDSRLDSCGNCKSNCSRCKCRKNNIVCTFYCKCDANVCSNRSNVETFTSFTPNSLSASPADDDSYSTDGSLIRDTEYDSTSFISESSDVYNQTDDSDFDVELPVASSYDLPFHIKHDHSYFNYNFNNEKTLNSSTTPKRQRTSSTTSVLI